MEIIVNRIEDISLFLRVLDLGSLTAAARDLGISLAVASKRIARLEREASVRLLYRTTRRLQATAEGMLLAERGRALVDELAALSDDLRKGAGDIGGYMRVTTSSSFGRRHIAPLVPEFLERHPRVNLALHFNDHRVDLIENGFDLAIRLGELADSTLVAKSLAVSARYLCAAPEYLRRRGVPKHPKDLAEHNCLLMIGSSGRQDRWAFQGPFGVFEARVSGNYESNLGEALREATLAGVGISVHSAWHVLPDIQTGRLRILLPRFSMTPAPVHALTPHRRLVAARVHAFVDHLATAFAKAEWAMR